jgi:hypothetical protein
MLSSTPALLLAKRCSITSLANDLLKETPPWRSICCPKLPSLKAEWFRLATVAGHLGQAAVWMVERSRFGYAQLIHAISAMPKLR